MSEAPGPALHQVVRALEKNGFVLVGRRGSHVRLQKNSGPKLVRITVPIHAPLKKTTVALIAREAGVSIRDLDRVA